MEWIRKDKKKKKKKEIRTRLCKALRGKKNPLIMYSFMLCLQVSLTNNPSKTGLGATSEFPTIELDSTTEKKQALWRKTQQRYKEISDHAK